MLIGNEFSNPVPDWVPVEETDAPFLSTTVTIDWATSAAPALLELGIIVYVTGIFFLPAIVILTDALASTTRSAIIEIQGSSAVFHRLINGAKLVNVLAIAMVVLSLPLFAAGAHYFEVSKSARRIKYLSAWIMQPCAQLC